MPSGGAGRVRRSATLTAVPLLLALFLLGCGSGGKLPSGTVAGESLRPPAPPRGAGVALEEHAAGYVVHLRIAPNIAGSNRFVVRVLDSAAQPVGGASVRLTFDMTTMPMVIPVVTAAPRAGGVYIADTRGDVLSMGGPWRVTVRIRRQGLPDITADFRWTVANPAD